MANKTKARTIVEDKWERNKYLQECDSDTTKDVIKIRLHMWQVKATIKRIILTPTVHYVKNQKTLQSMCWNVKKLNSSLSKENSQGEWKVITEIYRRNKKKRELAVIKVQDQHKIIKESGKKSKIRKIKEKEKSGKISRKGRQKK